jgi:molybdenum cofactor cytidylyltransferase
MISAIILAAGQSRRMGQPKMLLPWGQNTVIEQVVTTFLNAGVDDIVVITGSAREEVEKAIAGYPVRKLYNSNYAGGEMLSSLQCGLAGMPVSVRAALIGLGDQPQIQAGTVRRLCEAHLQRNSRLVVPSFDRKRGHPWLIGRSLWSEILALQPPATLRDFLNEHADEIHYVDVDSSAILSDLDTPDDYRKFRPCE